MELPPPNVSSVTDPTYVGALRMTPLGGRATICFTLFAISEPMLPSTRMLPSACPFAVMFPRTAPEVPGVTTSRRNEVEPSAPEKTAVAMSLLLGSLPWLSRRTTLPLRPDSVTVMRLLWASSNVNDCPTVSVTGAVRGSSSSMRSFRSMRIRFDMMNS